MSNYLSKSTLGRSTHQVRAKGTIPALALAIILAVSSLPAQAPPRDPLVRWMNRIAQHELQQREKAIDEIHTRAQAESRKRMVRKIMLKDLGGLPGYKGPLDAKVTGSIDAGSYVIEKVIYTSFPGFYITANVYRPKQPGRYPGVLMQAGHTQEGKPEDQRSDRVRECKPTAGN